MHGFPHVLDVLVHRSGNQSRYKVPRQPSAARPHDGEGGRRADQDARPPGVTRPGRQTIREVADIPQRCLNPCLVGGGAVKRGARAGGSLTAPS
jgi:hypothetical protein